MKLTIQNMVCDRCIEAVRRIFEESDVSLVSIGLGEVYTSSSIEQPQLKRISQDLDAKGFALVYDRETEILERIKVSLLDYIKHLENTNNPDKLSDFIAGNVNYNYSYLSKLYSDKAGETIERHLIRLKIERVKELLSFRNMTLSEIAWKLNYSSVQYLSNQFKKVTGKTVTEYLSQGTPDRKTYDRV